MRIDTASGLVTARAQCRNGKCERVTLTMNPSYAHALDVSVEVEGLGRIKVDIAYGGVFYALIDPAQFGLEIKPEQARRLVDAGTAVHRALNAQLDVVHPEIPEINGIAYTMFVGRNSDGELVGATIMPPGRIDRSPCGTGNSARLAVAAARGLARPGDTFTARSIIGSSFEVTLRGTTRRSPAGPAFSRSFPGAAGFTASTRSVSIHPIRFRRAIGFPTPGATRPIC